MEELNEQSNSEIIGVMIQLALTIAGAEETSGELIDLRLKKMDALKEEVQKTYDLYRSIIEADDWSYDESSRFSVFEDKLKEGKRSDRHQNLSLNFVEGIPKGIELCLAWNEGLTTTDYDGFGAPDDSFVAGELEFIGDDPTVNSILLAMCIFFCNIRNTASPTQNEAIELVLRSAKWVSIEDAEYVAETWLSNA